ncbi:sialic acid-binding Ig-like lectin 14, partial [Pseudorasbora parva]|uniref:sialic acid-binding Ig-like lectin 14 n=1 Tax=Pseudorasbora parva TaxID=51549 RepID=UPI00351E92FF
VALADICQSFHGPEYLIKQHFHYYFCVSGVYSAEWGVSYSPSHICALNDSSVTMTCTYTYPTGYQIINVFWTKVLIHGLDPPDLSEDPEYSQRLQYLGDKQENCTIRLSHVTQKDSQMYYFRFTTNIPEGKWIGKPGVTLTVTDLQVESPERVTEGDSVRLTCKSSCTLTDGATFIWYRNSQPLTERRDRSDKLLLQSVRREDADAPKSVSVSIIQSGGHIWEGDSVTLSCSSDSNPPALNFSWFKRGAFVGSGRIYNSSKISSDDSGEYKCKSRNQHGERDSDACDFTSHVPDKQMLFFCIPAERCVSWSLGFGVGVIVGLGGASAALIVLYIRHTKRMKRSTIRLSEIVDPSVDVYI